jgi:tyrosine-protein phosphatase 2/3
MPDFFTGALGQPSSSTQATIADKAFADAVVSRFGVPPLLTARLPDSPPAPGPSPQLALPLRAPPSISLPARGAPGLANAPAAAFTPVLVADLAGRLAQPQILILDIRPHVAYSTARIPRALPLSIPSTLLKRPLFSLSRLGEMLPAPVRSKLERWRDASFVLVYDADTGALGASSNVKGLLAKFSAEGADAARLGWIQGGFQSVWKERRDLVDQDPPSDDDSDSDPPSDPTSPQHTHPPTLGAPPAQSLLPSLRARDLDMAAFSLSSTTSRLSAPAGVQASSHNPQAFNPFFDTIRQNVELSQGITERIPLKLPAAARHRIDDLPFGWLRAIARQAGDGPRDEDEADDKKMVWCPPPPSTVTTGQRTDESSSPTAGIEQPKPQPSDVDEGTESLAMQFYKIELAEQRRLTGVMQHHSKESGASLRGPSVPPPVPDDPGDRRQFPYSITAGVEKGAKNR